MEPVAPLASSPAFDGRPLHPHRELLVAWTLLLLDRNKGHGYRLREQLRARRIDLESAGLYRLLHGFERDGWARSRWAEPVAGPRRRVYGLTKQGRRTLDDFSALIATTSETYGTFLRAHEHAVARRVSRVAALDEQALPAAAVIASTDEHAPGDPATSPGPPMLRPHKELLAGWLLLRLDDGPTYGYDLRREFAAQRLAPNASAVYRMLRRLEADKWLESRWLSSSVGPRRRFYRITTRGRRTLDEIAGLISAIRDLNDDYLREYEEARRLTASPRSAAA